MATKAQIKFTYEDYKSLPYVERQRYELLDGELIPMTPSPGFAHQAALVSVSKSASHLCAGAGIRDCP
jgi:Uma2 family endonuclease